MVNTPGPIAIAGAPLPLRTTPSDAPTPAAIRHVAEEFESVFLSEMMAPMFEGLQTDGLGGGGDGEQMFRPMLVERYAEAIARSGGIGIADSIVRELMRMQEAQTTPGGANGAGR